jgi:hypothetical protein
MRNGDKQTAPSVRAAPGRRAAADRSQRWLLIVAGVVGIAASTTIATPGTHPVGDRFVGHFDEAIEVPPVVARSSSSVLARLAEAGSKDMDAAVGDLVVYRGWGSALRRKPYPIHPPVLRWPLSNEPPASRLFKVPAFARRVIFACDATGSMITKFATLKNELHVAIDQLRVPQSFNVFLFQGVKANGLDVASPLLATSENRRRAAAFIAELATTAFTDPVPNLVAALQQQPDILFLVADGDFANNNAVLAAVREERKRGLQHGSWKVRIHTIAFVTDDDRDTAFIDLLKTIAAENNGIFKLVNVRELLE